MPISTGSPKYRGKSNKFFTIDPRESTGFPKDMKKTSLMVKTKDLRHVDKFNKTGSFTPIRDKRMAAGKPVSNNLTIKHWQRSNESAKHANPSGIHTTPDPLKPLIESFKGKVYPAGNKARHLDKKAATGSYTPIRDRRMRAGKEVKNSASLGKWQGLGSIRYY